MDEIMDQLNQVIEERVLELKRKSEEDKVPAYCTETKEHVLRMDRILNSLSEDDRQWLDDQLMAKMDIPEQERLRYYKAGLADAIELIHYLRTWWNEIGRLCEQPPDLLSERKRRFEMRNTTINVSFNTEKLDALKFHMEKRDTDLQGELNDTVQKLYEKYVPQATREYIDDKVAREISTRERTRRADRTVRREESQLEESEIVW
jgi:hypothetical protein